MTTVGSSGGLQAVSSGVANFATAHVLQPGQAGDNRSALRGLLPEGSLVVELFHRELGLLVPHKNPQKITSIRDLARPNLRLINRQPGSGTRIYLDHELARRRLSYKKISGYENAVSTHMGVGLKILRGEADAGLATRTTAQLLGLDFLFLTRERFDMVIPKDRFFTPGIQALLGIVGSRDFRERLSALGGYDVSESGRIINFS